MRRLIGSFEPAPAYVPDRDGSSRRGTRAQPRLPRIETLPEEDRSLLWVLFGDPSTRSLIVDWDLHARQSLAEFRASTTAVRDDPLMVAMVERLRGVSDEFDRWWAEHDVARFETRLRRFNNLRAGLLTFEYQRLPRRVAVADRRRATPRARRRFRQRLAVATTSSDRTGRLQRLAGRCDDVGVLTTTKLTRGCIRLP